MAPKKRKASGGRRGRAASKGRAKKTSRASSKRASARGRAARRPSKTASKRRASKTTARSRGKAKSAARRKTTAKSTAVAKKRTTSVRAAKGSAVPVIRSEPKRTPTMPVGETYGESNWKAEEEDRAAFSADSEAGGRPAPRQRIPSARQPDLRKSSEADLRESEKKVGEEDSEW